MMCFKALNGTKFDALQSMRGHTLIFCLFILLSCTNRSNVADDSGSIKDTSVYTNTDSARQAEPGVFSIEVNGHFLSLQQWIKEAELIALAGNPQQVEIDTLKNADTFNGSVLKRFTWKGVVVKTFLPRGKTEPAWIMEILVTEATYKTSKGLGIDDNVQKLKELYPGVRVAEDGRSKENNGRYLINDNDAKFIEFVVSNGIVERMRLFYQLN